MNAIVYALWLIKEIFIAGISLALAASNRITNTIRLSFATPCA